MKITDKMARNLTHEDVDEGVIIESGDWIQDGKYQYKETIFNHDGKIYSLSVSRSGSPFTDWYYEWEDTNEFDCPEVEKIAEVVYKWVKI